MTEAPLQRILAFNQELASLSAAGLPLEVGIRGTQEDFVEQLEEYSTAISRQCSRGESIEQAITESSELNPIYRAAAWAWIHCDHPSVVLDGISSPAETRMQMSQSMGRSMLYPLIVLSFAYLGFLYLCISIAPKIEAIYAQLWQRPSSSLSFLLTVRDSMPIWGPLLPLLVIGALIWWKNCSHDLTWSWIPGSSRYFAATRNANTARWLAILLESGCTLPESLELVEHLPVHQQTSQRTNGQGIVTKDGSTGSLLHWAVTGDVGDEPLSRVLRFVEQTYRQTARRQQTIWEFVTPTICGVFLGGGFVLGYGLSLFLPVVQMLKDVSLPGGG